jgi:hypothetical protein
MGPDRFGAERGALSAQRPRSIQEEAMLDIDWGPLSPSSAQRLVVNERFAEVPRLGQASLSFHGSGTRYEARFSLDDGPAIRLSDASLLGVVERMSHLLSVMIDELDKLRH